MVKEIDTQIQEAHRVITRWKQVHGMGRVPYQDTPELKCLRLKIKRWEGGCGRMGER